MPSPAGAEPKSLVPLCVDLDGTVIKTDLLWESLVRLLKQNALYLFAVPLWLFRGRAHLKAQIAARVAFDVSSLPYNHALVEFLRAEREFALSHRINPENWESDYLAKPDDERQRIESDWLRFLSAFNAEFRSRR